MHGNLSESEIEDLLLSQPYGHFGIAQGKDVYVVPHMYAYHEGVIYGHTYEGDKVRAAREHPSVCFQVENVEGPGKWKSAIVWGQYEELQKRDAFDAASIIIERLSQLKGAWADVLPFEYNGVSHAVRTAGETPIFFRINIEKKVGKFELTEFKSRGSDFAVERLNS